MAPLGQEVPADIEPSWDGGFVVAGNTKFINSDVSHVYVLRVDAGGKDGMGERLALGINPLGPR